MRIVDLHYHMPSSLWLAYHAGWIDTRSVTAFEAVEPVLHPETRRELVGRYEMLNSETVSELVSEGADELKVRCIVSGEVFHAVLHEPPAHLTRMAVPRFLAQAVG